jgi:hypothetical protein
MGALLRPRLLSGLWLSWREGLSQDDFAWRTIVIRRIYVEWGGSSWAGEPGLADFGVDDLGKNLSSVSRGGRRCEHRGHCC